MEFDKSRVYTALNADELKVGSKVFVAKNLHALRDMFCENQICTLIGIYSEDYQDRFCAKFDSDGLEVITTLAYLVSPPEEKKLKWTDLKHGDVITDGCADAMVIQINKHNTYDAHILAGNIWITDEALEKWKKVDDVND